MSVAKTFSEPLEQPAFPGGSVPGIPDGRNWHALEADAVVTFDGLFRNPFIWIAAVIVISLQLLAVYASPLARVLGTVRPLETDWLIVILCSVAPILIVETTKAVARWKRDASDGRALEAS